MVVIIFITCICFFFVVRFSRAAIKYRQFKGLSLLDLLLHFKSLHNTFRNKWISSGHPKLMKLSLGPGAPFVVATHPDTAKAILSNTNDIVKSVPFSLPSVVNLLSNNVLFSNGENWRRFRLDLSPTFHFDVVKKWIPDFLRLTTELLNEWRSLEEPIEMCDWLPLFTMDVLGKTVMGQHFNLIKGGESTEHESLKYLTSNLIHPKVFAYTLIERITGRKLPVELNKHVNSLYESMRGALARRKQDSSNSFDLVKAMLNASDWTEDERIANTFIMFVAGHETTARALLWLVYHLVSNPNVQEKLYQHVESVLHGQSIAAEHFKELNYVTNVIKENMRISPPVPLLFSRQAAVEVLVDGVTIPAGTKIGVSPHIIHHDPSFWPEPFSFNPDRFDKPHNPFAFLPFSLKSRACLGSQFSMVEQTVFTATLVQHFKLHSLVSFSQLDSLFSKPTELKIVLQPRRSQE